MKAFEYIENFFRIQFLCAFIILCLFLVHKKKKIEGFLGFSDYIEDEPRPLVNDQNQRIKDEIDLGFSDFTLEFDNKVINKKMQNKILSEKNLKYCPELPGFGCLRIGAFCQK